MQHVRINFVGGAAAAAALFLSPIAKPKSTPRLVKCAKLNHHCCLRTQIQATTPTTTTTTTTTASESASDESAIGSPEGGNRTAAGVYLRADSIYGHGCV